MLDLENVVCVSPEIVALVIRGECCLGYPWRSLSELALEIVVCVIRHLPEYLSQTRRFLLQTLTRSVPNCGS